MPRARRSSRIRVRRSPSGTSSTSSPPTSASAATLSASTTAPTTGSRSSSASGSPWGSSRSSATPTASSASSRSAGSRGRRSRSSRRGRCHSAAVMTDDPEAAAPSLRDALRAAPVAAYRDFFRLQEELRDRGDAESARALAEELWAALPDLSFESEEESARFHHNVAVFFGSPGDAADLARARRCFETALAWWHEPEETGWHARVLHNFATALANLGTSASELDQAISLFERALAWRTKDREIARAV